jgi:hypothetical protein
MSEPPQVDPHTFSPSAYRALIGALRQRGYVTRSFAEVDPAAPHLILRHDVDFSLDAARTMAEQEAELGVRSTYFILLRTEFYNFLSHAGQTALSRIAACGHTIGLHFDAALYPQGGIEEAIAKECGVLEQASNQPVTVVSFHRPTADRIGAADRLAGRINAYGPRFVKAMGYCSDSRGSWHHGPPLEHPAFLAGTALQLLTHPIWWQAPALEPAERLRSFLAERERLLDRELAHHCTVHRARADQ